MADAYILSAQDRQILNELIAWRRKQPKNWPFREEERNLEGSQPPEVYIARPYTTVPPITRDTTDTPGTALATIFKLDSDGDIIGSGFTRNVYNLSDTPIDLNIDGKNNWIPVAKTKYGKWLILYRNPAGSETFRNDSGESVPAFGLVRVTGTATVSGRTVLTGDKPNTTFQRLYLVNGSTAVADGEYGLGTFGPNVIAKYESGSPAVTESWGAKSGQWGLEPDRPGFTIMGTHTVASTAKTYQQPVDVLTAKTDAQIAIDNSGTCSVHFATSGTASEYNVTGHLKWMHNDEVVSSGKEVMLQWIDEQWLITGAECE